MNGSTEPVSAAMWRAIFALCPDHPEGIVIGALNYEGIRWPEDFTPPTKEAFEAELARQALPRLETSKLRFALELIDRGLWPTVKAAIEADARASLYWQLTDVVTSDNSLLLAMGSGLGLGAAEVREIIEAAMARQV